MCEGNVSCGSIQGNCEIPPVKFLVKYTLPVSLLPRALDPVHFAALNWDDFPARQVRTQPFPFHAAPEAAREGNGSGGVLRNSSC